uniref:4-coumarate--CoA ligase-like 1 n=1 Tax=Hirondellea gigas TaxID=1518452 RepID=A0A2P2HZM9_9CRUS
MMAGIYQGPAPPLSAPKGNCIDYVFAEASQWADKPALVCGYKNTVITYAELQQQIGRWNSWLTQHCEGIASCQAVVAILSRPSVECVVVALGTMAAGATFISLFSTFNPSELARQMDVSGTSLVAVSEKSEPKLREAFQVMGKTLPVVIIGSSDKPVVGRFQDIVEDQSIPSKQAVKLTGEEIAIMAYTSGSTGLPKCVTHSHNSVSLNTAVETHPLYCDTNTSTGGEQSRVLMGRDPNTPYPFFCAVIPCLKMGNCLVVKEVKETLLLEEMVRHKINHLYVVPPTFQTLLKIPNERPEILLHLTKLHVAGAPLHDSVAQAVLETMPTVKLQRGYGMSEILTAALDPIGGGKHGYTGQLVPNAQAKVLDMKTGELLPPLKNGFLHIKIPCTMVGYLNNPEATAEILAPDGWLNTGDIGHVDEDGYVFIGGRAKETIKIKNAVAVSPTELENGILEHPGVREVSVVGVLQPLVGLDSIYAFIVKRKLSEGASVEATEENIKELVKQKFSEGKYLTGVVFLQTMPRNSSGKVDRVKLKEQGRVLEQH